MLFSEVRKNPAKSNIFSSSQICFDYLSLSLSLSLCCVIFVFLCHHKKPCVFLFIKINYIALVVVQLLFAVVKRDVSERGIDLNQVSQIESLGIRIKRVRN